MPILEIITKLTKEQSKEYYKEYIQRPGVRERRRENAKKRYHADPSVYCDYSKTHYNKNSIKSRLAVVRGRARQNDWDFDLTIEDLTGDFICPVYGTKLTFNPKEKDWKFKASVDRFDNSLGYTKDNITIMSLKANSQKTDMTLEDLRRLHKFLTIKLGLVS